MVFTSVRHGDLLFTRGAAHVGIFKSSSFGHRQYCTACGTPLTMAVDDQPETVDFSVATLDEPDRQVPGFHIFWSSRIAWFDPADALPRHDRSRPETRGPDGTAG